MIQLLVVDDEKEVGTFLSRLFTMKGYLVQVVNSGKDFHEIDWNQQRFDVAMIDLKLPDCDGLSLLQHLKQQQPRCKVLIMTGYSTVKTAVDAMKLGASDFMEKPFVDIEVLERQIDNLLNENEYLNQHFIHKLAEESGLIVGESPLMKSLIETAFKVAQKSVNVLIEGETGSGKEVLSRFIHLASPRNHGPFIGINCGAISESLLESELFGHEKGAFTGATQLRKGFFEIAGNGTLFLDEIADASPAIQVKLLRVLETREFMRVGSSGTLRTNARLVAASNENLQQAVDKKKFREDLFYRLNVVTLEIPPLRKRKEDIPLLVRHLIERNGQGDISFSNVAIEKLQQHNWPGNIRELSNVVMRTLTLADHKSEITANDLSLTNSQFTHKKEPPNETETTENLLEEWRKKLVADFNEKDELMLEEILTEIKQLQSTIGKELVLQALQKTYGNRNEAAKRLQISIRKLRYILNEKNQT
ncbi:sigma-54 dependent transcriptional regulator [Peribacillus simplex]|uniref:Sigma-54 dependent transcriptional regulator n=1 Tax=Peribacillus simplex TaxID=1478 RepID=A0AAW7IVZ1_9BACI|nr:sigma-54 dependent transcriptional regulator [Peribacillus simplex]AMM91545.1 Fis family transcriptional regulator [Peribacillus simplex]MDM5296541.1 sigma-54 dependent transcriptional regulator [Peribacillus simplex]MDM5455586.1 sigma-54 dependent transcriptional regulator [Peribacillus simplex]